MMRNSQSRISKRRVGALARRQFNIKQIASATGPYAAYDEKALGIKLGIANADVENLSKKGVRA